MDEALVRLIVHLIGTGSAFILGFGLGSRHRRREQAKEQWDRQIKYGKDMADAAARGAAGVYPWS